MPEPCSWRRATGTGKEENSLPLPPLALREGRREVGSRQNIRYIRYIPYLPQRIPRQLLIHRGVTALSPNLLSAPSTSSSQDPALAPFPNYFPIPSWSQFPRGSCTPEQSRAVSPQQQRIWQVLCPFCAWIWGWNTVVSRSCSVSKAAERVPQALLPGVHSPTWPGALPSGPSLCSLEQFHNTGSQIQLVIAQRGMQDSRLLYKMLFIV